MFKILSVTLFLYSIGYSQYVYADYTMDKALVKASERGDINSVKSLVESDADVNGDVLGGTALYHAMDKDYTDIEKFLISKGADIVMAKDLLIINAAKDGDLNKVKNLIKNGSNINADRTFTPLQLAISRSHKDVIVFLIKNGAKIKNEFLVEAAQHNDINTVKLLIDNGADVKDTQRGVALINATLNGNIAMIKLLIDNGADVNAISECGRTALDVAGYNKESAEKENLIKLLKSHGAKNGTEDYCS